MRRVIIYSLNNGALTGFEKSFESSAPLPKIGTVVALGTEGEPIGTLRQGVVTHVSDTENSLKVGTRDVPTTEVLRDCLIKPGTNYREVPLPVW